MNKEEFRKEVHLYLDETLNQFEKYQSITISILKEFDRVCRKNDLQYWAAYGTLLGITRDGGQLPWDYDIDLLSPYCEIEKLKEALKKDLQSDFYYEYTDTMPNYPTNCLRVCKKGYDWRAIHVDVFFLIGVPEGEKKQKKFLDECMKYNKIRLTKYLSEHFPPQNPSLLKKIWLFFKRNRYFYISSDRLSGIQNQLCTKYPINKSCMWNGYGGSLVLPKNIFGIKEKSLGDFSVKIPSGAVEYLNLNYDNWIDYQPIQTRFEEFYSSKRIIDERQARYIASE